MRIYRHLIESHNSVYKKIFCVSLNQNFRYQVLILTWNMQFCQNTFSTFVYQGVAGLNPYWVSFNILRDISCERCLRHQCLCTLIFIAILTISMQTPSINTKAFWISCSCNQFIEILFRL